MKNLLKITHAKIIIAMFIFWIGLFIAAAVLHPGGNPKKYSDYSQNTVYAGWSAEALTK